MSDFSQFQEDAAWDHVGELCGNAGVLKAMQSDHFNHPLLARQLFIRLQALGYAVYRQMMTPTEARNVVHTSQAEAWSGRITSLDELLVTWSTNPDQRHPSLRSQPFIQRAQPPPGCGFFQADSGIWSALLTMINACAPCYCAAGTQSRWKPGADRNPRPHRHPELARVA